MHTILCLGEILWDVYPGRKYLGGAPMNVAVHASKLGCRSYMVSAVGRDELGNTAREQLELRGVNCRFVTVTDYPTGTAIVHPELDGDSRFDLPENAAYDQINLSGSDLEAMLRLAPDAVVFGTLAAKRSDTVASSLDRLLSILPQTERLYDVNIRKQLYDRELVSDLLDRTTILKLNHDEVDTLSFLLFDDVMPADRFARFILDEYPCHTVVVTRGAHGADAYTRESETAIHADALPVAVVDTVGAGDAFAAAYLAAWLKTHDVETALQAGNANGAKTASHAGAF